MEGHFLSSDFLENNMKQNSVLILHWRISPREARVRGRGKTSETRKEKNTVVTGTQSHLKNERQQHLSIISCWPRVSQRLHSPPPPSYAWAGAPGIPKVGEARDRKSRCLGCPWGQRLFTEGQSLHALAHCSKSWYWSQNIGPRICPHPNSKETERYGAVSGTSQMWLS